MRAAIIGSGAIARQHLGALGRTPGAQVVGVCDLSRSRAEMAAERFAVPAWFTDHKRMLAETKPEVVHVATPASSHFALAMDALEAGAHVIVEKPIATSLQQVERLIARGREVGRRVMEDHNCLFNRPIAQARAMRDRGELGEVTHVEVGICANMAGPESAFGDPNVRHPALDAPGGAIGDFLPHMAYLAIEFVGGHRSAAAHWARLTPGTPLPADEFRAMLECERGTATLQMSARSVPDAFWVTVVGSKARVTAHIWEPRLTVERVYGGPRPLNPVRNCLNIAAAECAGAFNGLSSKLSGGPGVYEGLYEFVRRVYAALESGDTPPGAESAALAASRLVFALFPDEKGAAA